MPKFLSLHLQDQQMVMLPLEQLTEVFNVSLTQIVPIPDVPSTVMGVCNWRGEVIWLVDLGSLLGFAPLHQQGFRQTNYKVVLLQKQGEVLGLAVPKVGQIREYGENQVQNAQFSHLHQRLQNCLLGFVVDDDRHTVLAIDGDKLLEQIGT
jgi:positive phototaxis protein PixI